MTTHPTIRRWQPRLRALSAALAAAGALGAQAQPVAPADKDRQIEALRAEVERLKAALAAQQGGVGAPAQAPQPAAAAASAPQGPAAAAPVAGAQPALPDVVVRSRNRIERLQDVPLSISVVGGAELDRLQGYDIDDVTKRLGNIIWNQGNQRTSSIAIRGIGRQSQTEAQDPSVGLIVDGVALAYNALSSSYNFVDIESIEVARGPQGTLLGKNTSIGALNVTIKTPSFKPSADFSLALGPNDRLTGTLAAGGPVIDGLLAYRATFAVDRANGDLYNRYENNRDQTYTNTNRASGRLQFLLTPTPGLNARLALELTPRADETTNGRLIRTPTPTTYDNGTAVNLVADPSNWLQRRWFKQGSAGDYSYERDWLYGGPDGKSLTQDSGKGLVTGSRGATLHVNASLGEQLLTSITAYRDYHFNAQNDDGTPFDISRNAGGFWNDYKQLTQELRLSGELGSLGDYQAGLYYAGIRNNVDFRVEFGNDAGARFANNAQYAALDATAAGRLLMQNSLDRLSLSNNRPGLQEIENKSAAVFGQVNWRLGRELTLTTGLRFTRENRTNAGSSFIKNNGNGPELNPSSIRDVQLGGFDNDAAGALSASNTAAQRAVADAVALKYFGVAATGTPGGAYNSLTAAQRQQVAFAKAIRVAQIGTLFQRDPGLRLQQTLPALLLSPSWKLDERLTVYASAQYGEKAGIAQHVNGVGTTVAGEKVSSLELGVKSLLLDKTLVLNTNLYETRIRDFQQTVRVIDTFASIGRPADDPIYTFVTGNAPLVVSRGLEVDGVYSGLRNTSIRFAGAYNDARYRKSVFVTRPNEVAPTTPFVDLNGQTIPGAPKFNVNIGADHRLPIGGNRQLLLGFNTVYTTSFNSDNSLSRYAVIPARSLTDLSLGVGTSDGRFSLTLLVKNAFDDDTPRAQTWNTITPAIPRSFALLLTGKL